MFDHNVINSLRVWARMISRGKPVMLEFIICPIDGSVLCKVFCNTGNPLTDLHPIAITQVTK